MVMKHGILKKSAVLFCVIPWLWGEFCLNGRGCGFVTLPFSGVAQRLKIKGKVLTLGVGEFTIVVVGFPWFLRGRMWELRLSFWF